MTEQPKTWIKFLEETIPEKNTRIEFQKFFGASLILCLEPTTFDEPVTSENI